jgi:predicted amidophosphoribosyltransferase
MRRKLANLSALAGLIAPPSCCTCGTASPASLCCTCRAELEIGDGRHLRIRSLDRAWAARPYDGVARELVAAVKFRRLLPGIDLAADLIASEAPDGLLFGALVPVPADPLRRAWRGFDPADLLASALEERTSIQLSRCLRRHHGARQVGRSRGERLASPPRVRATRPAPTRAILVDDVVTTGATLSACARAVRAAGAREVHAVAFAASGRALGAVGSQAYH